MTGSAIDASVARPVMVAGLVRLLAQQDRRRVVGRPHGLLASPRPAVAVVEIVCWYGADQGLPTGRRAQQQGA